MDVKERIKLEYIEAIKAGKSKRGLLTKLARKHGISSSTVRSWKYRENWDELAETSCSETFQKKKQNVATLDKKNVATEAENVATDSEIETEYYKYDWPALKEEFITGNYRTLKEFAEKQGINYKTLRDRAYREKWTEEKRQYINRLHAKSIEKTLELTAETLAQRRLVHLQIATELIEKIQETIPALNTYVLEGTKTTTKKIKKKNKEGLIDEITEDKVESFIDVVEGPIDPKNIKHLADALKKAQEVEFEAFGSKMVESQNIGDTTIQKVRERPKTLRVLLQNEE
ncbi:hypothetical protein BBF96_03450 [Anoxybacter fermentans]|uniref:PBSX phage terminase small subunit-like N-terminal domain-containing protein n=1 Tax=Anoxybacter fermentans TaxID=1323375 RepID=A0A3S9SW56_9FIRM|nr:phage terminase small subunit-related protein [Anoxybacter fermentans]AZR72519.1 hypothetical protein BBF96_03450 [Anoxybacter fermentans]